MSAFLVHSNYIYYPHKKYLIHLEGQGIKTSDLTSVPLYPAGPCGHVTSHGACKNAMKISMAIKSPIHTLILFEILLLKI